MSTKLNNLLIFASGLAIGAGVTYKVVKDRYERYIDEIMDRVDELFECEEDTEVDEETCEEESESHALEEMRNAYNNIVHKAGYTEGYLNDKEEKQMSYPYIISPEEFNTVGYNVESLSYFADDVLTDQYDNIIDDPEELIGDIDPKEHFGEYELDSIFIRNDAKNCDYEILRDTRNYYEVYPEE